jgi:hypothetical protein
MSPEEQRIAIAEVCGWVWYRLPANPRFPPSRTYRCLFLPVIHEYEGQAKEWLVRADGTEAICNRTYLWKEGMVPDYVNDLNAIHEATMTLSVAQRKAMRFWLYELTDQMSAHDATAAQRCEAFLRVLDLWKENNPLTPPAS